MINLLYVGVDSASFWSEIYEKMRDHPDETFLDILGWEAGVTA